MKKFISMVMAAAMVVSLVPATAFAAEGKVVAKEAAYIVDAWEKEEDFGTPDGYIGWNGAPELHINVDSVDKQATGTGTISQDIVITLDNAVFVDGYAKELEDLDETYAITCMKGCFTVTGGGEITVTEVDNTTVKATLFGAVTKDTKITFDLSTKMDSTDAGAVAKVSVESDIIGADAEGLVFCEVMETGIKVECKKVQEIGEDDDKALKADVKIKSNIDQFVVGQLIELELSNGFEFIGFTADGAVKFDGDEAIYRVHANELSADGKTVTIAKEDIIIDVVDAKDGEECVLSVDVDDQKWNGTAYVEGGFDAEATAVVAKAVADKVTVSVDEDEDVPEMWSGVDADNTGLNTGDNKHWALEVTVEENVEGAWDLKDGFKFTLPEGVYVSNMKDFKVAGIQKLNATKDINDADAWRAAYEKGEVEGFEFGRKQYKEVTGTKAKLQFTMELVAEPGFVGDVALTFECDGEAQEVVIAKFLAPFTVEAAQNDLIIDYRNTAVPTDIVVKEAEAGLWDKGAEFRFAIEKGINFEDDATYVVNEDESDAEIKTYDNVFGFDVKTESDDEAAVVTINGIELYMNRMLPAGAYDLLLSTSMFATYASDVLTDGYANEALFVSGTYADKKIVDVTDADGVVKEGFVNIITAGRDQDDASFTKKVVVPVGESYIVAGEETVALDVPAYVSAAGYTMLPVRAVAVALGINTNNVLWDQATKTVTILYGQRIITMTVGSKAINVNGSAIPASASPEVVDGRTFLPMRDLATALGVVDITWDAATKTATLNGNK